MSHGKRAPLLLLVAVIGMVAQDLVVYAVHPITALSTASLGLGVLLAWFLLRSSRVAWVLVVLTLVAQVTGPLTVNQPIWLAGSGAVLLVLLLSPPTWRFVWKEKAQTVSQSWHEIADRLSGGLWGAIVRAATRLSEVVGLPTRGVVIGVLAVCVFILLPLDGVLRHLHEGAESGSVIVDVLYRIVSIADGLAQIALVAAVIMAIYHFATKQRGNGGAEVTGQPATAQRVASSTDGSGARSPDPRTYTDLDRPKGWYIDPLEPAKMRHWGGESSPEWAGTTRTPRKLLRAWRAQQE